MKSLIPVMLVFLLLVLGCGWLNNAAKRSSANLNPYQGKLSDLLPGEISSGVLKFKLVAQEAGNDSKTGAAEERVFTYNQEAGGIGVTIDGRLMNYPTASLANAEIAKMAKEVQITLTKKGDGQRFVVSDGSIVWTNGSLLCLVKASVAKAAVNFENAASF